MKEKNIKKSRTYYNKIIIHKDELKRDNIIIIREIQKK